MAMMATMPQSAQAHLRCTPGETSAPALGLRPRRAAGVSPGPVARPSPLLAAARSSPAPAVVARGLAREVFASHPEIEGDPQGFLKVTEAYWKASRRCWTEGETWNPVVQALVCAHRPYSA